ncbi:MAG: homoserine dehydrogenase [Lachnospiraceae bacterium]|nr:homoserine dehydrogenase [Lachnospiraceae bacterium]MDD7629251.1 homoserine dehydrogenase [Lachnospiraceae bacterium]MDY4118044.1 homoserine dehydrogenase [Lachnospiraceae bacterium]
MIQVAVLGYGTVGSGVVEVIEKNKAEINKKSGEALNIKYILDLRDFPGDPYEDKVVHDVNVIMDDPEVKIICETMGGLKPAYDFTKRALLAGKSVCTSNKELVAAHGPELIRIAHENKCNYLFEASVGGGIPIIRPLNYSLTAEKIDAITGILNGTTNYILSKMEKEGADFAEVLKEAQEKGYAERNPEADVEGYDACRKIAILSSLMCGKNVKYEDIYTEGITMITATDFVYAHAMGKTIKLLAQSKEVDGKFYAMVAPFLIGRDHPLYMVNDVFNAVCVHGNMLGDSMYYGKGAGKLPTASAVVSDVVDCARHLGKVIMCFWDDTDVTLTGIEEAKRSFFVRVSDDKEKEAIAAFESIRVVEADVPGEFAFVTDVMTEKEFNEKAEKIGIISRIRIEE